MRHFIYLITLSFILLHSAKAQFSGINLTEYQYGQLPSANEDNFNGVYNRLMLNYTYQDWKVTAGGQLYQTPFSERDYFDPAWLSGSYVKNGWDMNVGNYYETLDRGILLRSYEITGGLLEDQGYRSKNYFYRDILGASAGFKNRNFAVKALWGYSLNNVYPPTQDFELRRSDEVAAISAQYNLFNQTVGASALRLVNATSEAYYGLGSLGGTILPNLTYYGAYAFYADGDIVEYSPAETFAMYASVNYSLGSLGMSLEWKNYKNFLIGSGVNEPPALIKEHSYRLLNRSTHVLLPENETGFQAEVFYQMDNGTVFTFNHTWADNDFGIVFKYRESFLDVATTIGETTELKSFVDYANDPFAGENNRFTWGFNLDQSIQSKYGVKLEGEWQKFNRFDGSVTDVVGIVTLRNRSKVFVSLITELSNDPYVTKAKNKMWLGTSALYKLNSNHSFQIFAGERRGGPACSAGICYEVLDFKGVELRWNARF